MILYLRGSVGGKMVRKLVKAINSLKGNNKLRIYLTSEGGETDAAEAIIDIINTNKDIIEVIFHGDIKSAAMEIFLRCECKRSLLRDVRGMYHYSYQPITMTEGGKAYGEGEEFALKMLKQSRERTMQFMKDMGFTEKEISDVRNGSDAYFTAERMLQLIHGKR